MMMIMKTNRWMEFWKEKEKNMNSFEEDQGEKDVQIWHLLDQILIWRLSWDHFYCQVQKQMVDGGCRLWMTNKVVRCDLWNFKSTSSRLQTTVHFKIVSLDTVDTQN